MLFLLECSCLLHMLPCVLVCIRRVLIQLNVTMRAQKAGLCRRVMKHLGVDVELSGKVTLGTGLYRNATRHVQCMDTATGQTI